jgi:hypothetical protein
VVRCGGRPAKVAAPPRRKLKLPFSKKILDGKIRLRLLCSNLYSKFWKQNERNLDLHIIQSSFHIQTTWTWTETNGSKHVRRKIPLLDWRRWPRRKASTGPYSDLDRELLVGFVHLLFCTVRIRLLLLPFRIRDLWCMPWPIRFACGWVRFGLILYRSWFRICRIEFVMILLKITVVFCVVMAVVRRLEMTGKSCCGGSRRLGFEHSWDSWMFLIFLCDSWCFDSWGREREEWNLFLRFFWGMCRKSESVDSLTVMCQFYSWCRVMTGPIEWGHMALDCNWLDEWQADMCTGLNKLLD